MNCIQEKLFITILRVSHKTQRYPQIKKYPKENLSPITTLKPITMVLIKECPL